MLDLMHARLARCEYEERVQQALLHYRFEQGRGPRKNYRRLILLNLSDWLIGLGAGLKQRVEMRPEWN